MIDWFEEGSDALRTVWMWIMVGPTVQPLGLIAEEAGFALGVSIPAWSGVLLGGLVAGVLVGLGERRYRSVLVASFLTAVGWLGLRHVLVADAARVYGAPRLVVAQFLLWIAAASLAVFLVFSVDYGRRSGEARTDDLGRDDRSDDLGRDDRSDALDRSDRSDDVRSNGRPPEDSTATRRDVGN